MMHRIAFGQTKLGWSHIDPTRSGYKWRLLTRNGTRITRELQSNQSESTLTDTHTNANSKIDDPDSNVVIVKNSRRKSAREHLTSQKKYHDHKNSKDMTAKANDPMEPNSGDNSGSTNGSWSQVGNEQYRRVEPPSEVKVPSLAHELQRVLFNPGVHFLKDPRTKHYNFTPFLENITQPSEFNYDAIQPYITSSKDKSLLSMAKEHNKRYLGSTSSVSAVLSHFYFTVSNFKPIDTSILSHDFAKEPKTFTRGTRAPASIYLRWKDGVYAVDVDKSHDVEDTILSLMGKSMEKVLTLEPNEYKRYLKDNAIEFPEEEKNQPESYAYGQIGKFLLRSQLDCYDSRLPRGTFDLKTRAAIPIRLDMSNYSDYLGYSLKRSHGLMESFEREYYDMMRSAFLKYSFQVRIGHMDGILVAYHNTSKLFGFQYISREEMDSRIFGTTRTGDEAFRNTLSLFEAVLDKATDKYPNQTLRLSFDARKPKDSHLAHMNIFVEAVPPEEEAKTESRAAEDTCVGQFFQTRDPALEPYRDMTMYILKTQSFVHGLPINENISLKRNTDDWEVRYKINEVAKDPVVVETMFRNLRKTQSKIFSASSYPIPILKKLKSLSKKELEKQGQEMDDSEHIKTEFE